MSQCRSEYARRLADDFPSPVWSSQVVIPFLSPRATRGWDSAMGAGGMVQALNQGGFPTIGTNEDFLKKTALPDPTVNTIITNPPYGKSGRLAVEFIEHALDLVPIVAMLLKVDFDSGRTRQHLFRNCSAFALTLTLLDRIEWFPGNFKSSTNHAWFVWDQQHRGPPVIAYAGKRDVSVTTDTAMAELTRVWRPAQQISTEERA
jgi:hypothetical protein